MGTIYRYKAFGLSISSEFKLLGPIPSDGQADVEILDAGGLDESLEHEYQRSYYTANKENIVLHIEDIGEFTISGGNKIKVKPCKNVGNELIGIYILGSCFGALLMQRGLIPIHGSALVENGKCFIVCGDSGAGKSTISAALRKSGCLFMADDISAIRIEDGGKIEVLPAYPQQKLWKDSVDLMAGGNSNFKKIEGIRDKYYYPVEKGICSVPTKLSAIFEIKLNDFTEVVFSELSGSQKLSALIANTFRVELFKNRLFINEHFTTSGTIAKRIPMFRMSRPIDKYTVDDLVSYIKMSLDKL